MGAFFIAPYFRMASVALSPPLLRPLPAPGHLPSSCQYDDDPKPTKTELVVVHEWKGNRILVNGLNISSRPENIDMIPDIKSTTLTLR
jgi:hypothetical protein